jgi:hypothetical protein
MQDHEIKIGMAVEFDARGKTYSGTVEGTSISRPGARKFKHLQQIHGLDLPTRMVVRVALDDGSGYWRCPPRLLRAKKGATGNLQKARATVSAIKGAQRDRQHARISKRVDARERLEADKPLVVGERLEVQLRDRYSKTLHWYPVAFRAWGTSGKIVLDYGGRQLKAAPMYVRRAGTDYTPQAEVSGS